MSLGRRYLDKAVILLFRNMTMQPYKGNAVACSKLPALETCSDSVWYFIGFNADHLRHKWPCHDSQTNPLDAPQSYKTTFKEVWEASVLMTGNCFLFSYAMGYRQKCEVSYNLCIPMLKNPSSCLQAYNSVCSHELDIATIFCDLTTTFLYRSRTVYA